MHGIYQAAIVTTSIAVAIFAPLIHTLKMPANERFLWLAALVDCPCNRWRFITSAVRIAGTGIGRALQHKRPLAVEVKDERGSS